MPGLPIGAAAGFVFGLVPAMLYGTIGLGFGVIVALLAGRAWGLRLLKRRFLLQFTGHESLLGYLYFSHFMRIRSRLLKTLNLRTLYVHHRLVIMRLES